MERETYLQELHEIEENARKARTALYVKYGLSQAKFKVGDIIRERDTMFEVDKITVSKTLGDPEPVYHGFELKKDLAPKKNGNRGSIYGNRAELVKSATP